MNPKTTIPALVILAVLVASTLVFTVEEGKLTLLIHLGKAEEKPYLPGLYFKAPWPLSSVETFDGRAQVYKGIEEQVLTKDQYTFRIQSYVLWRIIPDKAIDFYKSVGSSQKFQGQLRGLLSSDQNAMFGKLNMQSLFPSSDAKAGLTHLEDQLKKSLQEKCSSLYGVEVLDVGFTLLGVTEGALQDIYAKMSSERQKLSDRLKAEGEAKAKSIRAQAQSKYDAEMARARGKAKEIIAQAEASALEAYKSLAKDPELSIYLKKLDTMESLLKGRSTVILDSSVSPIDILNSTSK